MTQIVLHFPLRGLVRARVLVAALLLAVPTAVLADELQNSVGMKLRLIEAGRFERGERDTGPGFTKDHSAWSAGDEQPVHPVVLTRPFYLATTEVTVAQFRAFVEATGYKTTAETSPRGAVGWDPLPPADRPRFVATFRAGEEFHWRNPGFAQADDHPVVGVSFADAKAYCDWLSKNENRVYRLPTEAEWEYAARAGTQTYFSFGDDYRHTFHRHANIGNVELEKAFPDRVRRQWLVNAERDPPDQHVFTAPVGSYASNPWGLYDLHGNVWEWCEDRYLDTAYAPYTRPGYEQVRNRAIDPLNQEAGIEVGDWRVIRGGSWFNAPIQCRSAVRGYFEAGDAACYLGFRIAQDASAEQLADARNRFETSEAARETIMRLADRVQERRDGRLTIHLNQQRNQLNDDFIAALRTLDEPFDLHLDGRGSLTTEQLAGLLDAKHLRGLVISNVGSEVADADFAALEKHPQLELLHLANVPRLTNRLFQSLQHLDRLESLQFDSPQISDDGLQSLPALQRLKHLRLSGTATTGLALDHFRGSPLESFACDHLSDEGAQLLASFPAVREVSVAGSPITRAGLAAIAGLPRLQRLDVSRCASLEDADFAVLGGCYDLANLQLERTEAGDLAAAALARLNNLHDLQIGSGQLTDAGVRQLCAIVSLRGLQLMPEATAVTDAGLADLWRLVILRRLSVGPPLVTGSGLATLPELPSLEWLSLSGSAIADAACEHAARSDSLKQLSIGSFQAGGPPALSDAGLRHLAGARNLTHLELMRKRTQITDAGLAELRQERPQLNVTVRGP